MTAACERFRRSRNLECVSFCHGLAGLLTMSHSFYLETHLNLFSETAQQIVQLILNQYQPDIPFGFKCYASIPNSHEDLLIDNAGLLDGIAGTLLSLLFSTSNQSRKWIELFLIKSSSSLNV
ncbi:MAG: lanthionine synthetase LanC family protein [Chlamydiales bacterium]